MGAEAKLSREGTGGQKEGARYWGSEEKTPPKWMGLGSVVRALGYGERVKGQRGPKERSRGGAGGWGSPGNEIQRLGRPRHLPRAAPHPQAGGPRSYLPGSPCACTRRLREHRARRRRREPERKERES